MRLSLALMLAAFLSACGGSTTTSPVSPSATPSGAVSVTGNWSGTSSDTTGSDQIVCTMTQNGSTFTGTMSLSDATRGMMGSGTMTGSMTGSTVTFHMAIPTGGFSGTMGPCSMGADWTGTISADGRSMTGTYTGTMSGMMSGMMQGHSCGGTMTDGHFSLSR